MTAHRLHRGGATLLTTLVLVFLALLAVAFANRHLVFEQQAARNQQRAAQAFEAAEAGLDWALSRLNHHARLGPACEPADTGLAWRDHWRAPAEPPALHAHCTQTADNWEWTCTCPSTSSGLAATEVNTAQPRLAFSVTLSPAGPGSTAIALRASGCVEAQPPCEQAAAVSATAARLPALTTLPAAALTVRGRTDLSLSQLTLAHPTAASGGLTFQGGSTLQAGSTTRWEGPAGTPAPHTRVAEDSALGTLSGNALFASVFGLDLAAWTALPTVQRIDCAAGCTEALSRQLAAPATFPLAWLPQGLRLDEAVQLGSPEHPVVLVVDGAVQIHAMAVIHGVVYLRQPDWTDGAGLSVHGAVIAEADFRPRGASRLQHDEQVLQRLHRHAGTYLRLPGSWRDF